MSKKCAADEIVNFKQVVDLTVHVYTLDDLILYLKLVKLPHVAVEIPGKHVAELKSWVELNR